MIIGVTGCVGAGKSTASAILAGFGARVLDLDRVAANAVKESSLGLTAAEALAAVVKGGPDKARIEVALIPVVHARVAAWCAESAQPGVLDAALLFEHGLERFCDFTICVCCPIEERKRRVELRSTASSGLFAAIEAAQWPEEKKASLARLIVQGDGDLTATLFTAWNALSPTLSPSGRGRT
ncbi:MAG: dephospho-CoA kinase [Archangium sp.]|nr:dephospho-CoA kinase [Archangium sp.]MDP3571877.1 dephospho-CoA kinase [Archangium sp.]